MSTAGKPAIIEFFLIFLVTPLFAAIVTLSSIIKCPPVFKYLKHPNSFLNIFQIIDHKFHSLIKYNSPYKEKLNDLMEDYKLFQSDNSN